MWHWVQFPHQWFPYVIGLKTVYCSDISLEQKFACTNQDIFYLTDDAQMSFSCPRIRAGLDNMHAPGSVWHRHYTCSPTFTKDRQIHQLDLFHFEFVCRERWKEIETNVLSATDWSCVRSSSDRKQKHFFIVKHYLQLLSQRTSFLCSYRLHVTRHGDFYFWALCCCVVAELNNQTQKKTPPDFYKWGLS